MLVDVALGRCVRPSVVMCGDPDPCGSAAIIDGPEAEPERSGSDARGYRIIIIRIIRIIIIKQRA